MNTIILTLGHTLLADRRRALGRARAHAELATLVHHGGARGTSNHGRGCRAVEFVVEQCVLGIGGRFVNDAGPDGGERQEDAHDGEDDGAEFGGFLAELEAGEDGLGVRLVQSIK
jgi:hypothetical protein